MDRTARIAEEIKRQVSRLLRYELKDPRLGPLVSVLDAEVTRDHRQAKIIISVLGDDARRKEVMEALRSAHGMIRREVGRKLQLKFVPELTFIMDQSIEKGIYLSRLIDKTMQGESDGH